MLFISIPYDIQTVVKSESSLTGKSVRQILIEKLRGETVEKEFSSELKKNILKLDEIKSLKKKLEWKQGKTNTRKNR